MAGGGLSCVTMGLGLPYGGSTEETLRFMGLYRWLCDNDENPGVNDSEQKEFFCATERALKIRELVLAHSKKLEPLQCVMYGPFAFSTPWRAWKFFNQGLTGCEKTEILRCSAYSNPLLRVVMRMPLRRAINIGDVGKRSRIILELLEKTDILCRVWTSALSPHYVFIALVDDLETVRRVVAICRAYDRSGD